MYKITIKTHYGLDSVECVNVFIKYVFPGKFMSF